MTDNALSKDPRKERLAQALRDNLKRRKAQIRARGENSGMDSGMDSGVDEEAAAGEDLIQKG